MAYQLQSAGKVSGLGEIKYFEAPFDKEIEIFAESNYQLITARQLANARIKTGKDSFISQNGSWIREGDIYIPKRIAGNSPTIVLCRESLVLKDPAAGVKAHQDGKEISAANEQADYALSQAKKSSSKYFLLASRDAVPTNRFGEEGLTVWLFQNKAKEYGDFLDKEAKIEAIPLHFDGEEQIEKLGPYFNQLWLSRLAFASYLGGQNRSLGYSYWAFGVPVRNAAVGGSPERSEGAVTSSRAEKPSGKESGTYSPTSAEIKKYSGIVTGVRSGEKPAKDLEKILSFFERFRKD